MSRLPDFQRRHALPFHETIVLSIPALFFRAARAGLRAGSRKVSVAERLSPPSPPTVGLPGSTAIPVAARADNQWFALHLSVGETEPDQFNVDLVGMLLPRKASRRELVCFHSDILSVDRTLGTSQQVNSERDHFGLRGFICQFFFWLFYSLCRYP